MVEVIVFFDPGDSAGAAKCRRFLWDDLNPGIGEFYGIQHENAGVDETPVPNEPVTEATQTSEISVWLGCDLKLETGDWILGTRDCPGLTKR